MSDLISREVAVSILRARANMALGDVKDAASFFDYCANMIEKIPAVDAVHVVRCRDCVVHGNCQAEQVFEFCGRHDGFCCAGKRLSNKVEQS
nr:MAG TPA: Capsular polysaccharide biosynthesis protein [Caudoviricetes sp.]